MGLVQYLELQDAPNWVGNLVGLQACQFFEPYSSVICFTIIAMETMGPFTMVMVMVHFAM